MAKKVFKMTPAHNKFCEHYSEYGNATQAYLFAFPGVAYNTAKSEGYTLLQNLTIKEKIDQLQEEFNVQFRQDKKRTVRDLIVAAEEAKSQMQWAAYAKLRDMVIKLEGLYEPEKHEIKGELDVHLNMPGITKSEDDETEDTEEADD